MKIHNKDLSESPRFFAGQMVKTETFADCFAEINEIILYEGGVHESRVGNVAEILNFVTSIEYPQFRLCGGYGRDLNPFFLMAEALWILAGREDVATLAPFNSRMKNFSDDGTFFHGAYGRRIRGQDRDALTMLEKNPLSRRVVLSIWDTGKDLGTDSKDIPCNDLLMLKVREGKLHMTVCNRSNDINWGLTTNVFQFSVLLEVWAMCLGLEVGTETHISNSLHAYINADTPGGKLTHKLSKNFNDKKGEHVFYSMVDAMKFEFGDSFKEVKQPAKDRLAILQVVINSFFDAKTANEVGDAKRIMETTCPTLAWWLEHLSAYLQYKFVVANSQKGSETRTWARLNTMLRLFELFKKAGEKLIDVNVLSFNWFYNRLGDEGLKLLESDSLLKDLKLLMAEIKAGQW